MALEITYINPEAPASQVVVNARLCVSRDGKRLVPDGHPDAAFLFCTPGREVSKEAFEGYELDGSVSGMAPEGESQLESPPFSGDGESEADAEEPPAEEELAAEEEKPKRKARRKAANKALKGPEGDK